MSCGHNHAQPLPDYPRLNYGPGNKWIKDLTKNRLGTFEGGHFSDVNLSSVLFVHRVDDESHVKLQVWSAPGRSKPSFQEAMKQKFRAAKKGEQFGPSCKSARHPILYQPCLPSTLPRRGRQYEWPALVLRNGRCADEPYNPCQV